jgi:hypothetical protein
LRASRQGDKVGSPVGLKSAQSRSTGGTESRGVKAKNHDLYNSQEDKPPLSLERPDFSAREQKRR